MTSPTGSPSSRYRGQTPYPAVGRDGLVRATLPARPLPPPPDGTPYLHTVIAGETIESLAQRFLGASELWWRIADANPAMFPADLQPGSVLAIPTGPAPGLVVRTRSF
jgi:nucleoid-associated protein YgaU